MQKTLYKLLCKDYKCTVCLYNHCYDNGKEFQDLLFTHKDEVNL